MRYDCIDQLMDRMTMSFLDSFHGQQERRDGLGKISGVDTSYIASKVD